MRKVNYIGAVKDAWNITWRNRYLWWLGFLASLCGFGGMNYISNNGQLENNEFEKQALDFISQSYQWFLWLGIFLVLIFILLLVASTIGRAGLIASINSEIKGEKKTFKEGWREGKKYFWKFLLLGFFLILSILAIIIILATPIAVLFASHAYFTGAFLSMFAVLIIIPIIFLLVFLKIYGQIYIAVGKLSVRAAVENACRLFQKNLWESVVMSLFFIPLGIVWFFSVITLLIPFLIVFGASAFVIYLLAGKIGAIAIASIGFILFLAGVLFLRSVYETFAQSIWIFFFREIASPKEEEKVTEPETEKETSPLAAPTPAAPIKTAGIEK
ncbi:MAG: hypothetical protein QG620_133 [Patescibacteria group bacterium]|nr:hypothetical protein [Patescibacteria group bacterium]